MKKYLLIACVLLGAMLVATQDLSARPRNRIIWTKSQNNRTGLYTTNNYVLSDGISLNLNALYYFGDADNIGMAFHGGFNPQNLGIGGGLAFAYHLPASKHVSLRFSLTAGMLRGNNTEMLKKLPEPREDYRKFKSAIIQPAFGVEVYPFSQAGFYLYAGVAFTASIITDYEFYYDARTSSGTRYYDKVSGSTYGLLPMAQVGLGYNWSLTDSWSLGIEAMLQEGLADTYYMNLDAYPLASTQNSAGVSIGGATGKRWHDGWFQLGITVTYRWHKCEHCRISNQYF